MLKPSDTWSWYYDEQHSSLMLNLGQDMLFKTNLVKKTLVQCAFQDNEFTVDDASSYQTFKEKISGLDLSEPRQAELTLYCVAAKRFHKPVQPKSWFFDTQFDSHEEPQEGDIVRLSNDLSQGHFIVLEVGDSSSLCALIELEEFSLTSSKSLRFGDYIKVMHDRMVCANSLVNKNNPPMALVG
ncbi:cell division protein ZapC [Vibrio sp. T187]|uniref:cell division protein ZapC n=1 Tax=Vibrio TaxID=662 RepID=UPI0010C9363F|nr:MULTISPECIES: cell division protein ZapC [Vibrio]MBW3697008.1 cell division protein ZapC [Vibrio sp. T187]